MKLNSKSINYNVQTVDELVSLDGLEGDTVVVTDENRGGVFVYREDNVGTNNEGTIFNGWTRQYDGAVNVKWFGAKGDGVSDDTDAIQNALNLKRHTSVDTQNTVYNGTVELHSSVYGSIAKDETINGTTSSGTDYGIHLNDNAELSNINITHICNAIGTVSGRSNTAIHIGAKFSSDNTSGIRTKIDNVNVDYSDTNTFSGNTVGGFGNVADCEINRLTVNTNNPTGLQFHWGYSSPADTTYHPNHISINRYKCSGNILKTTGLYLSGCHDILAQRGNIVDCNQGVIIGVGDVGEGRNPSEDSKGKVFSNIVIDNYTIENPLNDAIVIGGISYVLGASVDALFPNQRWIAADYPRTNITVRDSQVLRGLNSTNASINLFHLTNVDFDNVTVGLKTQDQATDTTEALGLTAVTNSRFNMNTNTVVSVNALSGKDNYLNIHHINSDTENTRSQNGIVLRGSIVNATVRDEVVIGDEFIVIDTLTCDIHKGMKFEFAGTVLEFNGHARYDTGTHSNNTGVKIPILSAPIGIPALSTIEQYYCIHDTVVEGKIVGMHKGVRIISTDPRVPFNLEINADFERSNSRDIEVPLGIVIKRNGVYYYNDNGDTLSFVNGVPAALTTIQYTKVGERKIGYGKAAPTRKSWGLGDIIYNKDNPTVGWRCTVAGTPGTWVAF